MGKIAQDYFKNLGFRKNLTLEQLPRIEEIDPLTGTPGGAGIAVGAEFTDLPIPPFVGVGAIARKGAAEAAEQGARTAAKELPDFLDEAHRLFLRHPEDAKQLSKTISRKSPPLLGNLWRTLLAAVGAISAYGFLAWFIQEMPQGLSIQITRALESGDTNAARFNLDALEKFAALVSPLASLPLPFISDAARLAQGSALAGRSLVQTGTGTPEQSRKESFEAGQQFEKGQQAAQAERGPRSGELTIEKARSIAAKAGVFDEPDIEDFIRKHRFTEGEILQVEAEQRAFEEAGRARNILRPTAAEKEAKATLVSERGRQPTQAEIQAGASFPSGVPPAPEEDPFIRDEKGRPIATRRPRR